jgi:subtilase family serine protease
MRFKLPAAAVFAVAVAVVVAPAAYGHRSHHRAKAPAVRPMVSGYEQLTASETPPTQAQCNSAGRRCFNPASLRSAYNLQSLYDGGIDGRGMTIAVVDSYGSDTMAHDLHVYNQAWGLPSMCGEEGVTCTPGTPKFSELHLQGDPATKAPPPTSKSPGQEDKSAWALEVALDVETAHSVAPGANILLVTTPTAETLGVQGFQQMMAAEQYVIDHHLANVISQSFGSAEEAFGSKQSLLNLRHAFISAAADDVTVLASSGDFGTANTRKPPVGKGGSTIPFPTVSWPGSDPLVLGIGGTSLCTDATASASQPRTVDSVSPPAPCRANPGVAEVVWNRAPAVPVATGGGFSHVFSRPPYHNTRPAGSTPIPASERGVPDVALQADSRTGALVYLTLPPDGLSGLQCPQPGGGTAPCSTGWYDIGGTSLSSPQWAGIVALADQVNGGGLGLLNPAVYKIANDPARYANDFFDVTIGNNQVDPSIPGFSASPGWDPVTGVGTPNAANLVPDVVAAAHGH